MSRRTLSAIAAVVAALAFIAATVLRQKEDAYVQPISGRNNTALFFVLPHHGFSNVHLATAQALMERYPQIELTFVSSPKLEKKVKRISESGLKNNPDSKPIGFRKLTKGREFTEIVEGVHGAGVFNQYHKPGIAGLPQLLANFDIGLSPWASEEHLEMYEEIQSIIASYDPAVVVLDFFLSPAVDAARNNNRLHAIIAPNGVADAFAALQPYGAVLWKYPHLGSGLPFPVPWYRIPSNTYQVIRFATRMLFAPRIAEKKQFLKEHGVKAPFDFFSLHREDAPWLTQTTPGASIPVDYTPRNVSSLGPITVSVAPVTEQDPELANWLEKAPTVLIALGSVVRYDEKRATVMAEAIRRVLDHSKMQVLWKMEKHGNFSDDYATSLRDYIANGRVRIEQWLQADPTSILESENVVAFVHHGGANCFHEGLVGGVPHVILPVWIDLYNYANLAEAVGNGVWACSATSPEWTPSCIADAVLTVIGNNEAGAAMREKARQLGDEVKNLPGRYGAADIIAQLAGSGS